MLPILPISIMRNRIAATPAKPLFPAPDYRERVWGGRYLQPGDGPPIGELWALHPQVRIAAGPGAGLTLAEVAQRCGADLLGRAVVQRYGAVFPLLIKLLDTADWLSVQVHPNDAQARLLEGPDARGKAEAWHIVAALPDAMLIAGVRLGVTDERLRAAIGSSALLDLLHRMPVRAGETLLVRPGTIHALGPGLLVYEVQQASDITYRLYDWERPQGEKRRLHIAQGQIVAGASQRVEPAPPATDGSILLQTPWFALHVLYCDQHERALDTGGESFHALTALDGEVDVRGNSWRITLRPLQSVLVPAACGRYTARATDAARLLVATA